jgi:hypothetical protein
MRSKQEAASARAAAAQRDDARSRLSGLEVERQGYVARGDEEKAALVDDEISRYRALAELDDEDQVEDEAPDLTGLAPEEVFEVLGVPAEIVESFAAAITAKVAAEQTPPGDTPPADPASPVDTAATSDTPAEPTGRRGRAKTAAKPDDEAAGTAAPAPAGG